MENPATWGRAERIVRNVLTNFYDNQARAVTDPAKIMVGLSLERQITDALRAEGLLHAEGPPPRAFLGEKPCSNPDCECHR
jgi:hypothetical protein